MATPNNGWSAPSPQPMAQQAGADEFGVQTRPMGLKVLYSFDRDNQIQCLARWPHILQVQTMPLDDRTSIGVVDLRTCLQAVAQCSPEIVNQHDTDYSIYATDFSEQDWPLVGQGMLSWGLDQHPDPQQQEQQQQQQLVTGRVTRNLMALLSNGSRETLEVKLKLTAVAKRNDFAGLDSLNLGKFVSTPGDAGSEWNSFLQSNPMLGHTGNVASMPSPALPPAQYNQSDSQNSMADQRCIDHGRREAPLPQPDHMRRDSLPPHPDHMRRDSIPSQPDHMRRDGPPPLSRGSMAPQASRPGSVPPVHEMPQTSRPLSNLIPLAAAGPQRNGSPAIAPRPGDLLNKPPVSQPSRPSSRTRTRPSTGRPRGRPRKKPAEPGSTSAAEEATDGDDGPQKKRAKVVKTEYSLIAPFGSAPDSLRVAASTSGSLRNMRPAGSARPMEAGLHLQDVPRAPTPVPGPNASLLQKQPKRRRLVEAKGPETLSEMDGNSAIQSRPSHPMSQDILMSQDAFSPAESMGQSPEAGYSPIDSPVDLGSSPPVPRTSAYIRSSPPASSPVLPSMPLPVSQVDSGFMSGGIDDIFEDDDLLQESKAENAPSLPLPNRLAQSTIENQPQAFPAHFPFHEVHPGPPELLPTTSIFKPHGKTRALNRPHLPKAPSRTLTRCQTAPALHSEPIERPEVQLARQQALDQASHPPARSEEPHPPPPADIETVLQQALNQAVGNETSGAQSSAAEMALFEPMPIPDRPVGEIGLTLPTLPTSRPASRSASQAPSAPPAAPAPTNDSPAEPVLAVAKCPESEAPDPFDDDQPRYSKNQVKKQTIKERLEAAILNGESPPFCNNCGAIETPTWRKIWVQEHKGAPPPTDKKDFSDKPGFLTTVDVLERNADGEPMAYRLVKKHLGPKEDKKNWSESVLCNPCGIWLQKFKGHRPPDRWDKDAARLGQPRRKRDNKNGNGKGKNARSKSESQMNLTSEAYFPTDPLGPPDMPDSPKATAYDGAVTNNGSQATQEYQSELLNLRSSPKHRGPGSTHSRGSGTADSPIALDDDLGATRRLLFPSPRKDGAPKVLGELTANGTQLTATGKERRSAAEGKENSTVVPERPGTPVPAEKDDLDQELFGTPPNRPSTPPAKSMSSGVFKTPTRPTPSHRPITRSISRSIRSVRTVVPQSPSGQGGFGHLLKTPSKTPRSSGALGQLLSTSKRRSPRNGQLLHAHFSLDDVFDSPFTATLNQLLSEANDFTAGSPSHGLLDVELSNLPTLNASGGGGPSALDFGHFLNSTDLPMPSSPPLAKHHSAMDFGLGTQSFHAGDIWGHFESGDVAEEMEGINLP